VRILLLDIETMYMEARGIWQLKTDYIPPDRITKDWSVICYGAKWLFEAETMGKAVTPEEVERRDESSIIKDVWSLIDDAHIVVTQNGNDFDIRALNAKFAKHGLGQPSHYSKVDTKLAAREAFRLPSYSLDYMAKALLGIEGKTEMRMADWDNCVDGDLKSRQAAINKMLKYCMRDVAPLLEDLYIYLRPWMKDHPNLNLFTLTDETDVCPKCGGNIKYIEKPWQTPQGLWKQFRCIECGATGRGLGNKNKTKNVRVR
jgi:hypothetical protein